MTKEPNLSVIYSLAFVNMQREVAARESDWGSFISPEQTSLSSAAHQEHALTETFRFKAVDFTSVLNKDPLFDSIIRRNFGDNALAAYYRCSAKYYFDCFELVKRHTGQITKIVEVGPQFGDLSSLFAGLLNKMNVTLDLVDISKANLIRSYQNIKQIFPEAADHVRLFFGDLPVYIKNITCQSSDMNLLHYQGSTNFNDVIRDLGSTFHAKNKIFGTMVHNTHLRSVTMSDYSFLDAALYALFGAKINFLNLGEEVAEETALDQSSYFAGGRVDGLYLPYSLNQFRYPHPSTPIEKLLYQIQESPVTA